MKMSPYQAQFGLDSYGRSRDFDAQVDLLMLVFDNGSRLYLSDSPAPETAHRRLAVTAPPRVHLDWALQPHDFSAWCHSLARMVRPVVDLKPITSRHIIGGQVEFHARHFLTSSLRERVTDHYVVEGRVRSIESVRRGARMRRSTARRDTKATPLGIPKERFTH
jgi:hypothetical protein